MKKISLAKKIFVALILGCICGIIFNIAPQNYFLDHIFLDGIINLIGQAFTNIIKAMVVPLVFVSITLGVASIGNLKKLGRVGSKIIAFYFGTTAVAVSIAIFFTKFTNHKKLLKKGDFEAIEQLMKKAHLKRQAKVLHFA